MSQKPRMLILLFTELAKEPRANKQLRYLSSQYDITTVGYGSLSYPGVQHIELPRDVPQPVLLRKVYYVLQQLFFRLRLYGLSYRFVSLHSWAYARLRREQWDIVIAHDINTVPLSNRLRSRAGVIVDLHEYAPRQYEHSAEWVAKIAPYYSWICRREVTRAAAVVTVSQGIVDEYERQFGFRPVLVTNATPYAELPVNPVGSPIRLVHSGIAAPARKLEIMIEAVTATTADVTLDLFLVHPEGSDYLAELHALAGDDPRVRFREAVSYAELVPTLNNYDVGISIIAATTFNHQWSLPNKFFDFIQARLGIIIGPSPEMARIVTEHDLGAITDDFEAASLQRVLESLDAATIARWKANADAVAAPLSGERQVQVLGDIVEQRLAATGAAGSRG